MKWKLTMILEDDERPEPLKECEIERFIDSIDLPAGVKPLDLYIEKMEETK